MNLFTIKNYKEKYLKEVVNLFINTVHNINKKDYTKEQLNAWANKSIDLKAWQNRLKTSNTYLCMLEDEIVGFYIYEDDYIDCFYVHHKYQGLKIGKFMIEQILKDADNSNIKILRVDASITAAKFFEKFGFKKVKENHIKRENQTLINHSMIKDMSN
ncbi:GNAT family N-acetyltransferase [Arcobacter sp. YIC-464]|uniref:GNAT family N-acetyltransferase n=1 Tax=Arcobacter sp. YIC-464 TaxID=3376631 RepID=UPI003C223B14